MRKILRWVVFVIGFVVGYQAFIFVSSLLSSPPVIWGHVIEGILRYGIASGAGLIFGLILFFLYPPAAAMIASTSNGWIIKLRSMPISQIGVIVGGLIVALVLAALISSPILKLSLPNWLSTIIVVAVYIGLGYLGVFLCNQKYPDIEALVRNLRTSREKERERDKDRVEEVTLPVSSRPGRLSRRQPSIPKVLDTSVIIDGRIFDILRTGFLEGPIVVANFVLDELQLIADSPDALKRNRGRRGLDILNRIQKELPIEIVITDRNYPDISEVDTKLLKLSMDLKGKIVTNDYNLNKIAELQGVEVLNTNDLSNAVKSVVLPGEEMSVQVIKEGKEHNQGVAYLDDGTMIVIEDGKHLINKTVHVMVTSVLQTSAGRMIFARPVSVHA